MLHSQQGGKPHVRPLLEACGGSIVYESEDNGIPHYALTFLGVLLSSEGEELENLIVLYLDFACRKAIEEPQRDHVSSKEIASELHLTPQQVANLGRVLFLSRFVHNGSLGVERWDAGLPRDIEDLPKDLLSHVRNTAIKDYDPNMPVGSIQRTSYSPTTLSSAEQTAFSFVASQGLREQLQRDWVEARSTFKAEAWKACIILCGGILEGMLIARLTPIEGQAMQAYEHLRVGKKAGDLARWNLVDLVDVAREVKLLSQSASYLGHALRLHRDLVHPSRQVTERIEVTRGEAETSINTVERCIRELSANS